MEENLEEEINGRESWKQTICWGIGDTIKIAVVGGALLGGIYLASHPEYIEAAKDYISNLF